MKIMHFEGGLGNQMFQFAYFRYLESLGYSDIRFDIYSPSMQKHGGFTLNKIFPAIKDLSNKILPYYIARPYFLLGDVLKKIFKINYTTNCINTNNPVISSNKIWLRGTWQEFEYVDKLREQLLSDFTFIPVNDDLNLSLIKKIETSESVSIHIRRGDYLKPGQRLYFGDICNLEYYSEAISLIKEKIKTPSFFIFSNDIEWVKNNLNPENAIFINHNQGENSFRDLQLMSLCKHNIIANSSFSWWGAWLNQNVNKIVISPSKWFNNNLDVVIKNLIPSSWYKIGKPKPNLSLVVKDKNIAEQEIVNILSQNYFDFELLTDLTIDDIRVKPLNSKISGNHSFELDSTEIEKFRDKKYLNKKLKNYFKSLIQ